MITHSFYATDNRVKRYAETLAQRGDSVDVIALRCKQELLREETLNGVKVHRIQDRFSKEEKSKLAFLFPLIRFLVSSALFLNRLQRHQKFDLIHVHNIPDFLVLAALWSRLHGTKVILDIHDITPELFRSKFGASDRSFVIAALKVIERISASMADHVILSNHLWLDKYASRSAPREKCSVFINNVDEKTFYLRKRIRGQGKYIVMFPGSLQWHQGVDIAIRAFHKVRAVLPQTEFHIYGDGEMKPRLRELARNIGLTDAIRFFDPVSCEEIASLMAEVDLGVVPKRADSFGDEAYSTKIMEFMALGVPVVISRTMVDRYYFDDSVVRFVESGNADELAEAVCDILSDQEKRQTMTVQATKYVAQNGWNNHKGEYLKLVDRLCGGADKSVGKLSQERAY